MKKDYYLTRTKIVLFAKSKNPNLTANDGYDHQADNQFGGNSYDYTDSQHGRYGYDHQADNQYDGNGYDHTDSQYGRYGYDHQADNQYVNGYDHTHYQYSGNERNHRAYYQYGGRRSDQADNEGYGVSRRIGYICT